MTKKRYKPKTPEQIAVEAAERRERRATAEGLKAQTDVAVETDEQGAVRYARRLDVFELLRTRKRGKVQTLPEAHYEAVRALEEEMAIMLGQDRESPSGERVDGKKYPPGQNIADRQVDAAREVRRRLDHVGHPHARVLERLIEKPHGVLTRWRDTVQAATKIRGDEEQVDFILVCCAKLAECPARPKRKTRDDGPADSGQRSLGDIAMDRASAA